MSREQDKLGGFVKMLVPVHLFLTLELPAVLEAFPYLSIVSKMELHVLLDLEMYIALLSNF